MNVECGMRDAECGMRNAECGFVNPDSALCSLIAGYTQMKITGYFNPHSAFRILHSASRIQGSFAPFKSPAKSLIPTPGPLGTDIFPSFTVIGESNQFPYFSVPSLYS
jgi:hypothetical protein